MSNELEGAFLREVLVYLQVELLSTRETQLLLSDPTYLDDDLGNSLDATKVPGTVTVAAPS